MRAAMASSDLIITNETGNPLLQIGRLSRESEKQSGSLSFICIPELRAVSAFFFFFFPLPGLLWYSSEKSQWEEKKKTAS